MFRTEKNFLDALMDLMGCFVLCSIPMSGMYQCGRLICQILSVCSDALAKPRLQRQKWKDIKGVPGESISKQDSNMVGDC